MKINQVSEILNDVFNSVIGESANISLDLSNLVDVGRTITSSSEYLTNTNVYIKNLWDKVGQTLYNDVEYKSSAPDIYATDAEYGSVLEKIRIIPEDYEDNKIWTVDVGSGSTFEEMYGYHPAKTSVKYFNSTSTVRTKPVTLTEEQLSAGFRNRDEMLRFIGMVESAYISKIRMAGDFLVEQTINGFMLEKYKQNKNGVINLYSLYKNVASTTKTAEQLLYDPDFLKFAGSTVKKHIDFLTRPTMLYNTDGYVNFSKREDLKLILLSDFSRNLETFLYSDTFNPDYLKLEGYDVVPYWSGGGTGNDFESRSEIIGVPPSGGASVTVKNIVGVVFDKKACMVNMKKPHTGVQPNNFDKWFNYIWSVQAGYFADTGENGIIFVVDDTEGT